MNGEPSEDLTYIKYSAKEILFHLTQKVETLQADVNNIKLNMVSRAELTSTRRWALTAVLASVSSAAAALKIFN